MLPKPSQQPKSPRLTANPLSLLFFTWMFPFFMRGYNRVLTHEDVYRCLPEDETRGLSDRIEAAWNDQIAKAEKRNNKRRGSGDSEFKKFEPSLVKALLKVFAPKMAFFGMFALIEEAILKPAQTICLGLLLDYFANPEESSTLYGYLCATAVVIFTFLYTSMDHPFTFAVQHLGMRMRVSLCSIIYRKALRVSRYALEQTPAGQITNLLSSDMNRFDVFFTFFHYIWVGPIQLIVVMTVLYVHIGFGISSLAGVILIVLFVPFQGYMGSMFTKLRVQTAAKTDERLLALEEILSAMRVIKMYTWEKPYSAAVAASRRAEVDRLKTSAMYRALNQSFFSVTSRTTLFITLVVFVGTGNALSAKKVYMALSLYTAVQTVMTLFFPMAVLSTAETLVSIDRIRTFLLMEEKTVPHQVAYSRSDRVRRFDWALVTSEEASISSQYTYTTASFDTTDNEEVGVWVHKISAQWDPRSTESSFRYVSFDVRGGEILVIIGPTGSGKSSVLNSLLYELPVRTGTFKTVGNIAYSCQEPWLFNGSVRENILFGKPYNASWYDEVTEACALSRDFQLLTYGDRTLVGEKGSELSGGQRARVTLARAVYADADIYFLDDPLSAVDAQVGRHIVEKCIFGLLKNKCRILVTHQLQHIKSADKILVMVDGYVAHMGDYKSLQQSGIPFSELLDPTDTASVKKARENPSVRSLGGDESSISAAGVGSVSVDKSPNFDTVPFKVRDTILSEPMETEEIIMIGESTGAKTVYRYFNAGSSCLTFFFLIFVCTFTQIVFTGSDLWLQYWLNLEEIERSGTMEYSSNKILRMIEKDRKIRIVIYTIFIITTFALCLMRAQLFFRRCMKSSVVIYDRLFYAVLRSPISFFEKTPVGRILNRFAKDISIIDENLPQSMYDVHEIFMMTIGVMVLIGCNTTVMLIPSVVLLMILWFLRKTYFRTAITVKRLEGVARSPIFNHLSTTLLGLPTIRAFGVEQKFMRDFEDIQDVHTSCWYMFLAGTRWLGVTVDWIIILFLAGLAFNFLVNLEIAGDSTVGVTLTSAMSLTSMTQWGMRQSAELENHLISVERVQEYCDLTPEAPLESEPGKKPPTSWPTCGEIRIQNLCLRYGDSAVLRNISCHIIAGEKVGIVGRTGAGKSSLINVLFRLAEPTSGYIEIDAIETTSIGLHDLRSKISIIPQEPVIFGGTIRSNLDPFSEYTDAQLWDVLQEVRLTETVRLMGAKLDSGISEGGSNFSSGQKQLFCLARCILKRNKVLVLDEATASVDPETDRLIQKTIRRNFGDCTVLTIAHRLHTVMDSDRIIVLSAGQIMEFDEPQILLANRHSMLYSLVQQTGKAEASYLAQIAKLAAQRRRQVQESVSRDSTKLARSSKSSSFTTITNSTVDEIII